MLLAGSTMPSVNSSFQREFTVAIANCGWAVRMRPYASRQASPLRGCSPVIRNAGLTLFTFPSGTREVLLPEFVFRLYAPAVRSLTVKLDWLSVGVVLLACPREKKA